MFKFNEFIKGRDIIMSLELLNKKLNYYGGGFQQNRMITDKLRSLKKALLYSYQAATAVLEDEREFRCLINPDKNEPNYDNKEISIPYKDICLNKPRVGKRTEGEEEIGLKPGDVFVWKETGTHWLVYLQYLEENAYFRSQIRRCDQQVKVNDKPYWVYIRGPVQTSIVWNQKQKVEWNDLNHSLVMYVTFDENTANYFHRFAKIKVLDPKSGVEKTWQVVDADAYYGDGIIQVFLDEYFENSIAEAAAEEKKQNADPIPEIPEEAPQIVGSTEVTQYSKHNYGIRNAEGGTWFLRFNGSEQDFHSAATVITLNIGNQLGVFTLIYRRQGQEDITLNIKVISM